jgi:hypothetical protein
MKSTMITSVKARQIYDFRANQKALVFKIVRETFYLKAGHNLEGAAT